MKKSKYFYLLVQNKVTVKWQVASKVLPDTFSFLLSQFPSYESGSLSASSSFISM